MIQKGGRIHTAFELVWPCGADNRAEFVDGEQRVRRREGGHYHTVLGGNDVPGSNADILVERSSSIKHEKHIGSAGGIPR